MSFSKESNKTWTDRLIQSDKSLQKIPGIYKITNLITGIFYIGSAIDLRYRNMSHYSQLCNNKHHSKYFQRAWNKYGEENFVFEIIELVPRFKGESDLDFRVRLVKNREQFYLDTLLFAQEWIRKENKKFRNLGYNISPIAGSRLGTKQSKASKLKMSINRKGLTSWHKGKKRSEEFIQKVKNTRALKKANGWKRSQQSIEKQIASRKKNPNYKQISINQVRAATVAKFKKVIQIDIETNLPIQTWNSVKDAANFLGAYYCSNGIKKANQNQSTYRGFKWKYAA